jgi:hypothetical protein
MEEWFSEGLYSAIPAEITPRNQSLGKLGYSQENNRPILNMQLNKIILIKRKMITV